MKRRLLWALLALPACSSSASLSGSVSEIFPLDFNQSAIFVNSQSFEVDYYLTSAGSEDLVVELTVDTTGLSFQPGVTVDLGSDVGPGQPRATVVHQLAGGPLQVLPPISSGSLSLSGGGAPGQYTTGSFQLAFDAQVSQFGNGRTLSGGFAGVAQSAAFPITDGGIPGEVCSNGSCCVTPCGGACCPAGEACIAGACCPAPCGTSCCNAATQVCYTDPTGAQSCISSCTSNTGCQGSGLNCCAVLPGGLGGCIPSADVTGSTQCICLLQSECSTGCCAPSTDSNGDPVSPFVCKPNDGASYDCCNSGTPCSGGGCCAASPNGGNVCVTQCTVDGGECGAAACLGGSSGWTPSGASCTAGGLVCGP